jgi:hypothetical protein
MDCDESLYFFAKRAVTGDPEFNIAISNPVEEGSDSVLWAVLGYKTAEHEEVRLGAFANCIPG